MKRTNFSNLLESDWRVVEKKKMWFLIPAIVGLITAVMLVVYGFAASSPVNLGMDFAGGYAMTVKFADLTPDNYQEYVDVIDDIAENLSDEQGKNYGLKIDKYRKLGKDASDSAIYFRYKNIKSYSDDDMIDVSERLEEELRKVIMRVSPTVTQGSGSLLIVYNGTMKDYADDIDAQIKEVFPAALLEWQDTAEDGDTPVYTTLKLSNAATLGATIAEVKEAATINNEYNGSVTPSSIVSGTVSSDLINYAVSAILVALMLMLFYIGIRFRNLSFGLAIIIALVHDVLMMTCFMFIFHIEITVTFIAALITILGYSCNNTIIIFDRVRELSKKSPADTSGASIANKAIKDMVVRTMYTTVTTFIMIGMIGLVCALAGISDMAVFAAPIVCGLLSGVFSSICIAPSVWSMMNKRKKKEKEKKVVNKEPATI